jgi:hypothetical protein
LTLTAKFNLVFQYFIESTPCDFAENTTAENSRDNNVIWSEYDFIVQGVLNIKNNVKNPNNEN